MKGGRGDALGIDRSRITPQWLAGFFDGEGSVYAGNTLLKSARRGKNYSIIISVAQKDINVLSAIQAVYGGTISDRGGNCSAYGRCYVLRWCGNYAKRVLLDILPYSIVKRERIQLAIYALDKMGNGARNNSDRDGTYLRIRELNKLGSEAGIPN